MAPISTRLCFVSRYTVPKKFSGIDNCAAAHVKMSDGWSFVCHIVRDVRGCINLHVSLGFK